MEMKAEIIQRLQGPKAGQMENTNNFHNLYVKRHTNVRYAALFFFLSKSGEPICGVGHFQLEAHVLTVARLLYFARRVVSTSPSCVLPLRAFTLGKEDPLLSFPS